MLRALFVASLFLGLALAQAFDCSSRNVDFIPSNASGVITCTGYLSGVEHTFVASFATCTFVMTNWNSVYGTITLFDGSNKVVTWNAASTTAYKADAPLIKLIPNKDYRGSDFSISYKCVPIPPSAPIQTLVPGQSQTISNATHGGFVYLSLGQMQDGALQSYSVNIWAYRGLRPPAFFISLGRLPTLESYDLTNDTIADGKGGFVWQFAQQNPTPGISVLGMFLYGNFGGATVNSAWNYNYEVLPFNNPVSKRLNNPTKWCGQFTANPKTLKKFNLQVSRDVPGGYPIFYIAQGVSPTASNAQFVLDTNQNSFGEITVNSTYAANGPNPGVWIVCTQSGFSGAFYIGVNTL